MVVEVGGGLKSGGISTSSSELITNSGSDSGDRFIWCCLSSCVVDTAGVGLQSSSVPAFPQRNPVLPVWNTDSLLGVFVQHKT